MFVLSSTHLKLQCRFAALEARYTALLTEWNDLVTQINAKGGVSFLKGRAANSQFDAAEIKTLIKLCHPDKHRGAKDAEQITAKLLQLR